MNRKKILSPLFVMSLVILNGCGSFESEKNRLLTKTENKDLVNTFEIEKAQADKYKAIDQKAAEDKAAEEKAAKEAAEKLKASPKTSKGKSKKKKKKEAEVVAKTDAKTDTKSEVKTDSKAEKKSQSKVDAKTEVKAEPKVEAKTETKTDAATPTTPPTPAPVAETQPAGFVYPSDFPQDLKDYDTQAMTFWDSFKPNFYQGEQSIMAISYLGVTAGYITIMSKDVVKMNDKTAYHYYARFKSKDAYSYFYWLDDSLETFIDKATFLPMKYSLIQREKKQNVDDLQLFDFKKLKTYHWYKRVKEGNNKDEKVENYIPRFSQDSFSALQFVRGLPLKKGDHYDFSVVTRGRAWLLKVEVMGEETTSVDGDDVKAIKLRAETHFPGVLQKSGDINFWYAADEGRRLLKFQAKVKIGSIFGELVEYKPGVLVR